MGLLKIFVSSTCQDLKYIREVIGNFIHELGHEPIMSEYNLYYKQYCLPEQSCYDQIAKSDILIHIIGGDFGSPSAIQHPISIAEAELVIALKLRKPVFVFLYNPVSQDYHIYTKNKGKQISFNIVKDQRVFTFIDYIYTAGLPVYKYDYADDIKQILKRQLSYLFSDKLHETICDNAFCFDQNYVNVSKEFIEDFENCDSLSVVGLGQNRMIKSYYHLIKKKVLSNKNIRYILSDPNGEGAKMCARFNGLYDNISDDMEIHKSAINLLMDIKRLNPEHLKVKVIDIYPPFTMYAFNIESTNDLKMYIWLTPLYLPAVQRLGFKITGNQHERICKNFIEQFNMLDSSQNAHEIIDKYATNN